MAIEDTAPADRILDLPVPGFSDPSPSRFSLAAVTNVVTAAGAALLQGESPAGAAALSLAGPEHHRLFDAIPPAIAAEGGLDAPPAGVEPLAAALHHYAAAELAQGRVDAAASALALLLTADATRADATLGLATCAWREGRDDLALDLALQALALLPGHPRAALIAGLALLAQGQRRAAQAHLAAASRAARKRPECREDLRAAQRSLLLLHLN